MNVRNLLIAASAAVLLAPAAFAATTATKEDCASLQAKFDKDVAAHANAANASKAKDMAAEGEKLCKDGKTADGEKKLKAAIKELKAK